MNQDCSEYNNENTGQVRGVSQFLRGLDLSNLPPSYSELSKNIHTVNNLDNGTDENKNDSIDLDFSWCSDLTRLQWLKLASSHLRELPPEITRLSRLEHLNVSRNKLTALRLGLASMDHIRILNCRHNKIQDSGIPGKLFCNQELQVFDVSHNSLTVVPSNLISARSLLVLNLSHNQLKSLPVELFTQCTELLLLDVSHNCLVEMPAQLRRLTRLHTLRLAYNPLRHAQLRSLTALRELRILNLAGTERKDCDQCLPSDFGEKLNSCLLDLDLSDNGLAQLPAGLYKLKALRKLDLSLNCIGDLSNMVDVWADLVYLNLSFNRLTNLPASLCRLASLRKLYVNNNKLTFAGMPAGMGKLQSLVVFNAADNQLENIPEGLCRCGLLKKLILNDNCLLTLPDAIHVLIEGLSDFEVSGNPQLQMPSRPAQLPATGSRSLSSSSGSTGDSLSSCYNIDFSLDAMLRRYSTRWQGSAAAREKAASNVDGSGATSPPKDADSRRRRMKEHSVSAGLFRRHRRAGEEGSTDSSQVLEGMRKVAHDRDTVLNDENRSTEKDSHAWKRQLVRPDLDYSRIFEIGDVGQSPGLNVWEIDEFYPKLLDGAMHGTFYDGDCYIVLHTFLEDGSRSSGGTGGTEHLQWAIYFWIGLRASLDKKACAAMHAVNLRNLLGAECRTQREEQADESTEFLRLMPTPGLITVIEGNHGETGFLSVEDVEPPTRLYRIHPFVTRSSPESSSSANGEPPIDHTDDHISAGKTRGAKSQASLRLISVRVQLHSLDPKFVFVLDSAAGAYLWLGEASGTLAQTRARFLAERLVIERRALRQQKLSAEEVGRGGGGGSSGGMAGERSAPGESGTVNEVDGRPHINVVVQGRETRAFLAIVLNCSLSSIPEVVPRIPFHDHVAEDDLAADTVLSPFPVIYDVKLGKGYLELPQVSLGPSRSLRKDLLLSQHVYIIRSGGELFLWQGRQSAKFLRFAGIKLANECLHIIQCERSRGVQDSSPSGQQAASTGLQRQDGGPMVEPVLCSEGAEPQIFRAQFPGWEEAVAVDFSRLAGFLEKKRSAAAVTAPNGQVNGEEAVSLKVDLKIFFVEREKPPSREEAERSVAEYNQNLVDYERLLPDTDLQSEVQLPAPPPGSVKSILKQLILSGGGKWSPVEERWKGHFFSHDCYLIIARYWHYEEEEEEEDKEDKQRAGQSDNNNDDDENGEASPGICTTIYFWQGRDTSDMCLHQFNLSLKQQLIEQTKNSQLVGLGAGAQHRVITVDLRQQQEPAEFLAHFEGCMVLHQGAYADRQMAEVHDGRVEMFTLRAQGAASLTTRRLVQVSPANWSQLNSHFYSLIRVPGPIMAKLGCADRQRVFLWLGSQAGQSGLCAGSIQPSSAALFDDEAFRLLLQAAREIYDPDLDLDVEDDVVLGQHAEFLPVLEGQEDRLFWLCLGCTQPPPKYDHDCDFLLHSRLFRLSNELGYFSASEKFYDFCQDDLADDHVMMLDNGEQIYLWFGSSPSEVEKKLAPQAAKLYCELMAFKQAKRPRTLKYTMKGKEPLQFRKCFHGWGKYREVLN